MTSSQLYPLSSNLRFISKFEEDHKVNISNLSIVAPTNIFTKWIYIPLLRWVGGESRDGLFKFVSDTYNKSLEVADRWCTTSKDKNTDKGEDITPLINDLEESLAGIESMKITYRREHKLVSELEVLARTVSMKVKIYKEKLASL